MYCFASLARRLSRRLCLILFVGVMATPLVNPALAQQAQLAKDIATGNDPRIGFQVESAIEVNGKFILEAANPRDGVGYELYEFDPATGSNRLLKDILVGQTGSSPRHFVMYNNELYFTAVGTNPGDSYGIHRYKPSTGEVTQVPVSSAQDMPLGFYSDLKLFDNKLYFSSSANGQWVAGFYDLSTTEVQLIELPQGTLVYHFLEYNNNLLLVTQNNQVQTNVFLYELTAGATAATAFGSPADSNLLRSANAFNQPVIIGNIMYFSGSDSNFDNELYSLNLATSTYQRYDINQGGSSSNPQNFYHYQGSLYFSAIDGVTARELFYVFGPNDGAPQAIDVTFFSFPSFRNLFGFGDHVYFTASTPGTGGEPYRIDINTRTTEFLGDLYEGPNWSSPSGYIVYNQQLYTHLSTFERGGNYHVWNPSNEAFELVGSGNEAPASSYASDLYVFGDYVYFKAVTADYATELFRYSQTTNVAEQLTSFTNAELFINASVSQVVGYQDKLFFAVQYQFQAPEFYSFDVATKQLNLLATINDALGFSLFINPMVMGDKIYFSTDMFGQQDTTIGVLDPQTGSISSLNAVASGLDPFQTFTMKSFNGRLYFSAIEPTVGYEVFYYDPQSNAIEVLDIYPGSESSFTQLITATAEQLLLRVALNPAATDPSGLYQVDLNNQWSQIEGGPAQFSAMLVKDGVAVFAVSNTVLGFYDFATGEITTWESADPQTGNSGIFFNGDFFAIGDDVLVLGNSNNYGQGELFKIDFSNHRATVYAEINEGPLGSLVMSPVEYGNTLYFGGFRPDVGHELFKVVTNTAPAISGTPATTVAQDAAYSFTPTASDADNDALTFSISGKPAWASFSTSTGALTGTPGNSDVGVYENIVISVTDGKATSSLAAFSITVTNVNDAPTISGTPSTLTVLQDQVWSFTPTIADIDVGDALLVSLNAGAPAWLSVNGSTISGTPGNSDVGITPEIVVTVTDVAGASASLPGFSITVQNVNDPPTISGEPPLSIDQDQLYSFTAVGADVDLGDELQYTVTGAPAWLTVNDNVLMGTPGNDDVGVHGPINIKVTDLAGAEAALPPFTITVNNVNDAPTITGTPLTTATAGQLYSFSVQAADIDKDDVVTLRLDGNPSWLSVTQAGVVSGTPTEADVALVTGISVVATDQNQAEARLGPFQIDVKSANNPPVIILSSVPTATQGELYTASFEASDEAASTLTWDFINLPSWLTATQQVGRAGVISGTPDQAAATVGMFNITVRVTDDGALTDSMDIVVIVVDINVPPVWTTEPPRDATQDQAFSLTLTASDDDNDTVVFSAPSLPSWLTLQGNILSGTPRNADVGMATPFVLTASDQNGGLATLNVAELLVANVNDAPTISGTPPATAKVGIEYTFEPDFEDIDIGLPFVDEALTFTISNAPNWLTINPGNGSLSGTPTEVGEHRGIVVTVTDKGGLSDSLPAFDITVGLANQAPDAVDDEFSITFTEENRYVDINVLDNDTDPDGDILSIVGARSLTGPIMVSINNSIAGDDMRGLSLNLFAFTPSYRGEIEIEYTITDPSGLRDTAIATVIVNGGAPSVITLTPPADLTVKATGALTLISSSDLGTATATDQNNKTIPVSVSGLEAKGYVPGLHTVIWSAGSGDSQVSKAQMIRVIPQVSLEKDLEFAVGDEVKVPVLLSGPAPEYPYSVTLSYIDGRLGLVEIPVTFESGTETSGTLSAFTAASETRTVSIKLDEEGVNAGDKVSIQVSSPAPEQFTQSQEFVDVPFTSVPNQGSMVISVKVVGGKDNSAGAQIAFRLFNPGGIRKFTALRVLNDQGEASARVQFGGWRGDWTLTVTGTRGPQGFVNFKSERTIRVRAGGGAPSSDDSLLSQFEYNPSDDDLSRELDQNGNGFVDYQDGRWDYDGNGISAYLDRSLSRSNIWTGNAYAQTTLGQSINTAVENNDDPDSIRMAQTPVREESPEDPIFDGDFTIEKDRAGLQSLVQAGMDISNYRFFGEFYAFRVQQLLSAGATAQVALPLDEPLAGGSEFLLWQDDAWRLFEVGAGGALYSASSVFGACPAVDSSDWQLGLNEGHWCVRLDIVDGGVNDSDGEADTTVQVFGGAAIDDAGNTQPVAVADSAVAVWRGSVSIPVLANDTDADGHSLSIVSASVDIGTVTVNAARTNVQYVSPGDFAGVATITYVVSDNNGGMAVGTATVTVLENRAPVLGADSAVTIAGRPVSVNVLANDADPDGDTLSITGVSVSSGMGTASFSGATVSFVPGAGFVGVATVSYVVSDGRGGSATGTLTVQVNAAPEVIQVRPATGSFWWWLTVGGLLLAWRRRSNC